MFLKQRNNYGVQALGLRYWFRIDKESVSISYWHKQHLIGYKLIPKEEAILKWYEYGDDRRPRYFKYKQL